MKTGDFMDGREKQLETQFKKEYALYYQKITKTYFGPIPAH